MHRRGWKCLEEDREVGQLTWEFVVSLDYVKPMKMATGSTGLADSVCKNNPKNPTPKIIVSRIAYTP